MIVAVVLVLGGRPLQASAEDLRRLTLAELETALDGGLPDDALARARVLDAEAELMRARQREPLELAVDREEVFTQGESVVLKNAATLRWSVDLSGARGLRIGAARSQIRAARYGGERIRQLARLEVVERYLRAAGARLRVEELERTREPIATLVTALQQRAREGDVAGADVARLRLALSEHDDRLRESRAAAVMAERRLAALLGWQGRAIATDAMELPAPPGASGDSPGSARAELRVAREQAAAGRRLMRASSRWWIPRLGLTGGYLSTDFGPGSGPGAEIAQGYLATVSLSVPVFSRGRAEERRGRAALARAEARRQLLGRRIAGEIGAARAGLRSAVERALAHRRERVPLADELVAKTRAAYDGGEASALELRDAYQRRTETGLRGVELKLGARLAELELWRALGARPAGEDR